MCETVLFKMKTKLLVLLAITLLSSEGQASKLDKGNLQKDTNGLMHLDFEAFRNSKLGSTLINWTQSKDAKERIDSMLKDIGFNPFTALNGVTISTNGEKDNAILILNHSANTEKVLAYIKLADGYYATKYKSDSQGEPIYIHSVGKKRESREEKPSDRGYISFVDNNTAVIASSRTLTGAGIKLVKGQGGEISLPQISKILKKAKLPIVVSYADIDGLEEIIEDSNIKDMVREVVMVLGESDGQLVMSLQVIAQSVETAESLHDMVNGLIGFASLSQRDNPEIMDMIKAVKITRKQSSVSADFVMSVDKILEYADPELEEFDINLGADLNKK